MDAKLKNTLSLIKEAKQGDNNALSEVCVRYLDRIHKIVRFRMGEKLRRKAESMDIVQNVMLKVVKDIDQFDAGSESKFINWLAKIVENTIRDNVEYFAAQKRRLSLEVSAVQREENGTVSNKEFPDKDSPTVTQEVDNMEKMSKLEEALDQLNVKQREVIILRNYTGMTFKEISEILNSSEDAVRMLFIRSMDKLTTILADKFGL